jgi:hypothetical protein
MRYLFHNIYGDAAELIESKPDDVLAVPFGWNTEAEEERNRILSELGVRVSSLPALVYFVEEHIDNFSAIEPFLVPAHWKELRISDLPKPWSWQQIEAKLIML